MKLSNDLISQFVNITNDTSEPIKETTVYGTVVVDDDITYVQIDGSDRLTPVTTVTNVIDGERVTVMIKNHSAVITGNITSPSARGKDVELSVNSLNIKIEGFGDDISNAQNTANNASSLANSANNAANAAQNTANNAYDAAEDAARYATDYLSLDSNGLKLGSTTLDKSVLITPTAIDFKHGNTILASYGSEYIYLGKSNNRATINLANGLAKMYNYRDTIDDGYNRFVIEADDSVILTTERVGNAYIGRASIDINSSTPWDMGSNDSDPMQGSMILQTYTQDSISSAYSTFSMDAEALSMTYRDNLGTQCGIHVFNGGVIQLQADQISCMSGGVWIDSHVTLSNNRGLIGTFTDEVTMGSIIQLNANNNTVIGYGGWENNKGQTNIYGRDIEHYVGTAGVNYNPYYRYGDSISGSWIGAGYVSAKAENVYFTIPLAKPVIGSPTVTASSVDGLMIRQNNGYAYGCSDTKYVKPSSYSATVGFSGNFVRVTAKMPNTTDVTNNSCCGIAASIKLTFS